ncbi:MAG: cupin [Pseudomonadota bacterium]
MDYVFLTLDEADGSRLEDREMAMRPAVFAPPADPLMSTEFEDAKRMLFLILPKGWTGRMHASPARQVAILLSGAIRVEAANGDAREIKAGGIWRMEDTEGPGHRTLVISDEDVRLAIVQLA